MSGTSRELAGSSCVTGSNVVPVEHVPHGVDVVGLHVLVLEVEGVLPHVQKQKRHEVNGQVALLVRHLLDDQALTDLVVGQHSPAGALQAQSGGVEVFLELVKRTEVAVDGLSQRAGRLATAVGGVRRG